ncbi:MAG TPA: arginine--tRNA ligase [Candidatus Merdivicinus excrementipullorum]|uniref:Arginine--tRNA ligase n=1 Tax=Candidatus Merdivicinus excrementipullorum TaxID=2840867 RepID=A0A9D1FNE9_9FIRM|nr:arginine--tRNA ligase [Candidatus Merdivicinus excrementipullorum]
MANPVFDAKNQCRALLQAALEKCAAAGKLPEGEFPEYVVEIPGDTAHGDFAANAAMVSARAFRKAPKMIADSLASEMDLTGSYFSKVEVAGPGFINFTLAPGWFANTVKSVLEEKENYGRTNFGEGKKVLVEFVSANPTGPMHIGNARGGALGDGIASVLDWAGYEANREFYVNDAGNQINKFGLSLDLRYQQLYKDGVEMPEDSYHGQDIIDHAKNFAAIHGDKYMHTSEEERRKALVEYALPLNIQGLERDLAKYRIHYDRWFRESTLHADGSVMKVVELLKEKGHTYEEDGATWFKATEFGADKDFVLVRGNGVPTYVVPDIAYHYGKLVTRGYDKAIDVLGADHHGYVPRLKAALQALGVDPSRLDVVLMQMVRLIRDGEVVKASKRSGKAITLVTLLDEVPIDAARFYFNLREANSQFDFDLDLAVEQSSQNPVYYVQYAHARICSILKKLEAEKVSVREVSAEELEKLNTPEEIALIRHIARFPAEIIEAAKAYDPAKMTRYALDLATLFHKFYTACKVFGEEESLMQARLALCLAARTTLRNVLSILKIDAPETM